MNYQAASSLQTAVVHAIGEATSGRWIQVPPWRRSVIDGEEERVCLLCLADLTAPGVLAHHTLLIPPFLGGTSIKANRIRLCASCSNFRYGRDVVNWTRFKSLGTPDSHARVLALREQVLTSSANHLTATRVSAPRDKVLAALQSRWAHARVKVFAFQGTDGAFIGWTPRCGTRAALGELAAILRFGFQATPAGLRRMTLFSIPADQFLEAIWALIEHGTLVEQLQLQGHEALPLDVDDWRHWWPITFNTVGDLQRRRPALAGNQAWRKGTAANAAMAMRNLARKAGVEAPEVSAVRKMRTAPRPARPVSMTPAAIRQRKRYAKLKHDRERRERELAYRNAKSDFDRIMERVRSGEARWADFDEYWEWQTHVWELEEATRQE